MIFVTVGTHEQQFNRLIECIDNLKRDGVISEEVVMQTGFSTYEPKCCTWQKLYPYPKMVELVRRARIVITHGGPSSFIMPLQVGKIPVVVPRKKEFDEHVNDHQVDFAKAVEARQGNIIVVENMKDLVKVIIDYNEMISSISNKIMSNNRYFNIEFAKIVDELFV